MVGEGGIRGQLGITIPRHIRQIIRLTDKGNAVEVISPKILFADTKNVVSFYRITYNRITRCTTYTLGTSS